MHNYLTQIRYSYTVPIIRQREIKKTCISELRSLKYIFIFYLILFILGYFYSFLFASTLFNFCCFLSVSENITFELSQGMIFFPKWLYQEREFSYCAPQCLFYHENIFKINLNKVSLVQWIACPTTDHGIAGSIPGTSTNFKFRSGTGSTQPRENNWVAT